MLTMIEKFTSENLRNYTVDRKKFSNNVVRKNFSNTGIPHPEHSDISVYNQTTEKPITQPLRNHV